MELRSISAKIKEPGLTIVCCMRLEKMIQMHQGEMYTIDENHVFTVEICFDISVP